MTDTEHLDEIYQAEDIVTEVSVGFWDYVRLGLEWAWDLFWGAFDGLDTDLQIGEPLQYTLMGLVLVGLFVALAVYGRRVLRRTDGRDSMATGPLVVGTVILPEQHIRDLIAQGDYRQAIAALWAWVAGDLARQGTGQLHPDSTQREFLQSVGSDWHGLEALRSFSSEVERGLYGPSEPSSNSVEALLLSGRQLL